MVFFILFEHATGYGLFRCREVEDIGALLPEVQEAVTDFAHFNQTIMLEAFSPFKSGLNALENVNAISEGLMHDDLKVFLLNNLPKKKSKCILGVSDAKLGGVIQEALEVPCQSGVVVAEISRGLRVYFPRLVKGMTAPNAAKAQLGLGHSYSRTKVKFNVNRSDNMIIQSISLLDQLDKDINTFAMRIREWYSYHFPELIRIVTDNRSYARVAGFIGNRKELSEDKIEKLQEIVLDGEKCEAIVEAARVSMGMDISPIDLINIQRFASRVIELSQYRQELSEYLSNKMALVAPNLTTLIGEQVGARLISHAGSLTNLAKYPASTVQILGAEKALFRALKTRGNTPKYGLIFHSSFIGRAGTKNKGRISRYLANKCSIASRIDSFTEFPTTTFGKQLREQVEERLVFFETGAKPRRNIDVMELAIVEVGKEKALQIPPSISCHEKKKKKKKKRPREDEDQDDGVMEVDRDASLVESEKPKSKKKKKSRKSDITLTE